MSVDVTKDSSTCLACVYLNEYKVAVAAFTLHASENKLVRVGPHCLSLPAGAGAGQGLIIYSVAVLAVLAK